MSTDPLVDTEVGTATDGQLADLRRALSLRLDRASSRLTELRRTDWLDGSYRDELIASNDARVAATAAAIAEVDAEVQRRKGATAR